MDGADPRRRNTRRSERHWQPEEAAATGNGILEETGGSSQGQLPCRQQTVEIYPAAASAILRLQLAFPP